MVLELHQQGEPWSRPRTRTSLLLFDDSFTVQCDVVVVTKNCSTSAEDRAARSPSVAVRVPPPDVHRHLGELLASRHGADVVLEAGGEAFRPHRCVLAARSAVFKAGLLGSMAEAAAASSSSSNGGGAVRIGDMLPQVFKAVLQFVYTDTAPGVEDKDEEVAMAQHLLQAADRFDLQRLKLVCEDKLCRRIDTDSVVSNLLLAEQHGCQVLKERASSS